ncbi:hypothetical protein FJZ31_11495 [Candidatus Poribacteria bacterium]|nr:hypothetical protein [Candidatus Poribacteria bacterium]
MNPDLFPHLVKFITANGTVKYVLKNAELAKIDSRKLHSYALDPTHPRGGANKAHVFKEALGFDLSNWKDLYQQLLAGVRNANAIPGKVNEHGRHYTVDIRVTGPKGEGVVRTGWIYKQGSDIPELTTLLVAPKSVQLKEGDCRAI